MTDLVLVPFGAVARRAARRRAGRRRGGFDTVWTYDHFSGLVQGAPWSRDPFVTLGAIAATTERINVGVLVANVANRHPAQLACAVNSLQSLAPGRVLLGIGAGTSAGSEWSAEAAAIGRAGRRRGDAARRCSPSRSCALRAIWAGEAFAGEHVQVAAAMAVTDGAPLPPIIVGAGSRDTIAVGLRARRRREPPARRRSRRPCRVRPPATPTRDPFEVSAFARPRRRPSARRRPGAARSLGIERRTLYVAAPFPVDAVADAGDNLNQC